MAPMECVRRRNVGELVLRCAATLVCMLSLMLLVRDQQIAVQEVGVTSVTTQLRYSSSTGLVYLVYANGLVALYCFVVVLTSSFNGGSVMRRNKSGAWALFVLDQVLACILLSAASAASEIAFLVEKGAKKTIWDSKCIVYGHFCRMLEVSIATSFIAVIMLGSICVLSAKQLFQQYTHYARIVNMVKLKSTPNSLL
uniref:CASP-like protein 2U1 n=1 Tax=Pteridium aquilinum subsp. aquilinum TaxID=104588 RepID=CSPL3_PTEAA|nr:RecName: Full=CASP-like protein 2U1; Short=PaCASPL2U1 [Pteridium aquilinum subsp. aquilinum]